MIIVGLDISTSTTGMCVIDSTVQLNGACISPMGLPPHVMVLDRVELQKCKTIWEKADKVRKALEYIRDELHLKIEHIAVEEPMMGFRAGKSSAQTISLLMRFNGIVSYVAREVFACDPEYVSVAHARKLCGIKLQRTAIGGPQKEQAFAYMQEHDLKDVQWPLKKNGKIVDWSRDANDAYVIAHASALMNT